MKLLPILLSLAFAANAFADPPPLIWCNGCTLAAKETAALAVRPVSVTEVYVGDLTANTASAFTISSDNTNVVHGPTSVGGSQQQTDSARTEGAYRYATPEAGNPSLIASLNNAITYYHTAPAGWAKKLALSTNGHGSTLVTPATGYMSGDTIPYPNPNQTVYDVINIGPRQNDLTDWVLNVSNLSQVIGDMIHLGAIFKVMDNATLPTVAFTIQFADGSKIEVDITGGDIKTAVVVPSSARDSNNNSVPYQYQSNSPMQFRFGGTGTNYIQWLVQIGKLGYTYYPDGSAPAAGSHGWACVQSGEGPDAVYTCYHY